MRNEPKLVSLVARARQNPQSLQPLLAELCPSDPHLVTLVRENQGDFMALLNGPAPQPAPPIDFAALRREREARRGAPPPASSSASTSTR